MALLPAPVGITTTVSWPATTAFIASSCPGRSSDQPKALRAVLRIVAAVTREGLVLALAFRSAPGVRRAGAQASRMKRWKRLTEPSEVRSW